MSPGQGKDLAKDMEELLEELKIQIPELFASDEYRQRRDQIFKEFTLERNRLLWRTRGKSPERGASS